MELNQITLPSVPVNEWYGPVVQGEGPLIGHPCYFLRVHNCPVRCPGCDTAYSWNGTEPGHSTPADDLRDRMLTAFSRHNRCGLVVTGGEPLLYHSHAGLRSALSMALDLCPWVQLETSGYAGRLSTRDIDNFASAFTHISLSPKITPCLHGKQSDAELMHNLPAFIDTGTPTVLKFVVRDINDVFKVAWCTSVLGDRLPVYVMPYGQDRDTILRTCEWLVPHAAERGWIITPRLHSLMWGAERGR